MLYNSKILLFVLCLFVVTPNKLVASPELNSNSNLFLIQIDSLIKQKNISNDMTKLELLVLYNDALFEKHPDSVSIFKNLAIINADLNQPKDALVFTKKYINNTLDFSILNDGAYNVISDSEEYETLSEDYRLQLDWLTFLFLYVALIGFFFTIILSFSKKSNRQAKLFIGGFVGVHSLFILEFVLYISNFQYKVPHTYLMASAAALLYGPLLYLYFKSVISDFKFRTKDLLHFLPSLILILFLFPMYSLSGDEKVKIMLDINVVYNSNRYVIFISKVLSLTIYAILIGRDQYLYERKENHSKHNKVQTINKWKKTIYKIHIVYLISYIIYGLPVSGLLASFPYFINYIQVSIMSIMVIYLSYMAYVQPEIFKQEWTNLSEASRLSMEKYQKSGLTNALSKELKENLIKLFVEDKVYKENNINLEILSERLNTTRHNTSQIINEHFNMNFFELINKFRIKETINILKNDTYGNLNIIDIAYEVGYNNKVTFNKAFKKETSLTPSEFINSQFKKNVFVLGISLDGLRSQSKQNKC
ncbi:helix-turn-helix domain-containing protein [Flavivirga jejuensis]|uniref:Helix-turn-helix domain-containing protein n=1 Tax=Flavivirga jejuensis TaxID=870487 RepID=A0ABT8WMW1_9FLAO|nr:helix-turn-helix domain-containing protein [Flavivirga jejuensis]MDO5974490.1 helix-turn-helix domain-containing protein [Flavivirga jejuensis]